MPLSSGVEWIVPDWPVPERVRAVSTLRAGGVSASPYASLNLAAHVGDHPAAVQENRRRLAAALQLPTAPCWLHQVHGTGVVVAAAYDRPPVADACVLNAAAGGASGVCAVLTADCLPVLFCDRAGTRIAAAHAGWRGLAGGVLAATVAAMAVPGEDLLAWLGPAIGQAAYEVGDDVREVFVREDADAASAFAPNNRGRWQADLSALARLALARLGVTTVYGGNLCTAAAPESFFSFRRDGQTGRMATLIWMA